MNPGQRSARKSMKAFILRNVNAKLKSVEPLSAWREFHTKSSTGSGHAHAFLSTLKHQRLSAAGNDEPDMYADLLNFLRLMHSRDVQDHWMKCQDDQPMEHASRNAFLPSTAPSSAASTSTVQIWDLPKARTYPLTPGSQKEIALIDHVDARILHINRRYAMKFSTEQGEADQASGYEDFKEVSRDLDAVFNIVWISGTRRFAMPMFVVDGQLRLVNLSAASSQR